MSHCDWFTWHVGTWSGVSAGEVVEEVAEVVGKVAAVVGEVAEVVGAIVEVVERSPRWSERSPRSPTLAWSHLQHDISMASSELNHG